MRLLIRPAVFALVFRAVAVSSSFAEESPAAVESKDVATHKSGVLERPKDSVKHPDLDKAWTEYKAVASKAAESLKTAIVKQFQAATDKGDLALAEAWQESFERFEKHGELPDAPEMKVAASSAAKVFKSAKEDLVKAYDAVVKSFTKEKKLAEAKAVRDEAQAIRTATSQPNPQAVGRQQKKPEEKGEYLSDLQEQGVEVGFGSFGKNGDLGYNGLRVFVGGVPFKKTLSMAAPSKVTYEVPIGTLRLDAVAAINDAAAGGQNTPLIFKVFSDKGLLWQSRPLLGGGRMEECRVALKGVARVTLVVECPGDNHNGQAVWLDPKFVAK